MDLEKKKKIFVLIDQLINNDDLNEEVQDDLMFEIQKLSPDPQIGNYIFWSDEFWKGDKLDIDGVIEKAFAYKPIILGDGRKTEKP